MRSEPFSLETLVSDYGVYNLFLLHAPFSLKDASLRLGNWDFCQYVPPRYLTLLDSVIILFPIFIDSDSLKFLLRLNSMNSVLSGFICSFRFVKYLVSNISFFSIIVLHYCCIGADAGSNVSSAYCTTSQFLSI